MHLRKAWKLNRIETCHVTAVAVEEFGKHIAAAVIACRSGRRSIATGDDLEFRKRRLTREIFIRIDRRIGLVVDREQTNLIEIDQFFHDFSKSKTQLAVAGLHSRSFDSQVFGG